MKNEVAFTGLKKKKEDLESELDKLGSIRDMQLKESEASGKISGLDKKIQYAEIEKVLLFAVIYEIPYLVRPIVHLLMWGAKMNAVV